MKTAPAVDDRRCVLFVGADAGYMVRFRGAVLQVMREQGYRVVVLATPLDDFDPAQVTALGCEFVPWSIDKVGLNPAADWAPCLRLWRLILRLKPNIVFAHTIKPVIYAMILAAAARVPRRVAMIPGLGFAFTSAAHGGLRGRLVAAAARTGYRRALSCANIVLFQNPDDRADLARLGVLPSSTQTEIVNGSGVDMTRFAFSPPPEGPVIFLMIARLLIDKGVREFVEAARRIRTQVPNARFILAGAADANPAAVPASEIDAWKVEGAVEIRGFVADPRTAYAECHVFVLPSYREGTPRTNLEAMSSGRAVITTDAPGCRETVSPGVNGLLVQVRDAEALTSAMLSLARDPERVRQMGLAGRRICAERFELNAVASATAALIQGASLRVEQVKDILALGS